MSETVEKIEPRVATLGEGRWLAGTGFDGGLPCIYLGPAPDQKAPGTASSPEAADFASKNGAVIIRFISSQSMLMFLDLIHELTGLTVAAVERLQDGADQ